MLDNLHSLHVVSANVGKCHSALLSLLSTSSADCILVQEPAWTITPPLQSDSDLAGVPCYHALHHPSWSFLVPPPPYVACNHGPHVMVYWYHLLPFSFSLAPIPNSYCLLGIDVSSTDFFLWIINFYHHMPTHGHELRSLLDLYLPPHLPCLVAGNFNSHSHMWSLPQAHTLPWAQELEEWFLLQDLTILNPLLTLT